MNQKFLTPFKVGLLVLVMGAAFAVFYMFIRKGGLKEGEALTAFAMFNDASGLGTKSRVQIAGIAVGEITKVELVGMRARVTLRIRRDIPVKVDAAISKRSESILGDYLLDLYPGTEKAELLPENGEIKNVNDRGRVDEVFERLGAITADIQEVTKSLKKVLGGEKGSESLEQIVQNLVKLSTTMERTIGEAGEKLNNSLSNFEAFSGDIRSISQGQDQTVHQIVANVRAITEDTRVVLGMVKKVLGAGEGELKESVASLKVTLGRLDESLRNVESVTKKIDEGNGTLGRLVNDQRLSDNLANAVEDASGYIGQLTHTQMEVALRSEFHLNQRGTKNYLQLRLIPKPDKYYLLELVDDPRGYTTEETVQRLPPDATEREQQTLVTTRQQLKFSAQFAKRWYFLTLRFGIIESTGGVGANMHFLDDALSLRMDAFEFSAQNKDYPRLKAYMNYNLLGHVFFTAGVDDALNRVVRDRDVLSSDSAELASRRIISGRDVFFGGGIYFTDDDLRAILTIAPRP